MWGCHFRKTHNQRVGSSNSEHGGTLFDIDTIGGHPSFNEHDYDVAVIQLNRRLYFHGQLRTFNY